VVGDGSQLVFSSSMGGNPELYSIGSAAAVEAR
jgi:hypothetical protein